MKYNIVEIIEKKIYNKKLKEDEIDYFVKNYTARLYSFCLNPNFFNLG